MVSELKQESAIQPSEAAWGWRTVTIAAALFFTALLAFSLHRYFVYYADSDHGIFTQVFWNNLHGRFFQSSVSATYSVDVRQSGEAVAVYYRRLAQHFTPALLLWLPFYALLPSPITLVVLKVALVAAAGLVLYALSRHYLNPRLSVMIVLSFYCANTVIGPALGEFYDACQFPLFFFTMMLALEKRIWWLFWLMTCMTLTIREDAGLVIFGTGLYLIFSRRYPKVGLAVCGISFLYMLLVTTVVMPLFTDEVGQRFMIEEFGIYTNGKKASTLEVIRAIVSQPGLVIQQLIDPPSKTIKYLLGQWLPLAFIPVLSMAAWLISGFPLGYNLLRDRYAALSINIRYTTPVVPGLFYGAILWWSTRQNRFKSAWVRRFWTLCLILSLVFTVTSNPHRAWSFIVPDSIKPWIYVSLPQQWQRGGIAQSIVSQIPPQASLSASRYLAPHVAQRRALLLFPDLKFEDDDRQVKSVDYVAVDLWYPLTYQPAFRVSRGELTQHIDALDRLLNKKNYRIVDFKDKIVLLQRNGITNEAALNDWQAFRQEIEPILKKIR